MTYSPTKKKSLSEPTWVFGYGSLIYKVDFPFLQREVATIVGWQRRFWQGSHDHRGTPEAPGRVVTLIPAKSFLCKGIAYLVEPKVFEHLDHREKNGYQRFPCSMQLENQAESINGVVYVANQNNPAFLGPAPIEELAGQISESNGPSGSNRDYLLDLAQSLRELGESDPHVEALEALVAEPTGK